jgi:hypothetical protein
MFSQAIKTLFMEALLPEILKGIFGSLLGVPFLGNFITWISEKVVLKLLEKGIIVLKVEIIDQLSNEAKVKYAPMITVLRESQTQDELTPEQEAEYERRLKEVVRNRPGVVGA